MATPMEVVDEALTPRETTGAASSSGAEAKAAADKPFQLSSAMSTHTKALRDVTCNSNNIVVVAEERGLMRVWQREEDNSTEFKDLAVFAEPVHTKSLVFCVEAIPKHVKGYEKHDAFVSGGNDLMARVWTSKGSSLGLLQGHKDCVNSISFTATGEIVTGCWDGQVRFFSNGQEVGRFGGHTNAVEVLGLPSGEVVSGSSAGDLQIHSADRQLLKTVAKAHNHAIRKLILHPLGFASCSNDGHVKVWSNTADCLLSIAAHVGSSKTDCFVYGLCVLPGGELVSSGEDAFVRVWASDGSPIQAIRHPGPVRAVKALPNGDFVTACTDRGARIFTKVPSRFASEDVRGQWDNLVNMAMASKMQDIDIENLPGEEALINPGAKDGAIKLVRQGGKAIVFKWDAMKAEWTRFGEALGAAQNSGQVVDGKEWDIVTDVYVTKDRKHALCMNKNEDPNDVADRFIAQHQLPSYTKQQIVEFITPLVDMEAVIRKKEVDARTAAERSMKHVPCWEKGPFSFHSGVKVDKMRPKLLELSAKLQAEGKDGAMTESEQKTFDALMHNVGNVKYYHSASVSAPEVALVNKLLNWPTSMILPVLDMYRALMLHDDAVRKLGTPAVQQIIFGHLRRTNKAEKAHKTLLGLTMKIVANWVAKRIRTAQERADKPSIPAGILAHVMEALDVCASGSSWPEDSVVLAYVELVHNIVYWLGKVRVTESDLFPVAASGLFEVLEAQDRLGPKTVFFALLSIASMGRLSAEAKSVITDAFGDELKDACTKLGNSPAPAVREVVDDTKKVFGLR